MNTLHLKVITPRKVVIDETISSVTVPTEDGEITILPEHVRLFSLLVEGIVKIKKEGSENDLAIGGGYLETDGKTVKVLVSRAYGQDEIDHELTNKAIEKAKQILSQSKDERESGGHDGLTSVNNRLQIDKKEKKP